MKRRVRLSLLGILFLIGIFLGTFWGKISLVGIFLGFLFLWKKPSEKKWIFVGIIAFSLGVLRIEITQRENPIWNNALGKEREVSGFLEHFPDRRHDFENWTLTTPNGKILLKVSRREHFEIGAGIRVRGILEKPFETDEFSYAHYLAREKIFAVMNFPQIKKTGKKKILPILTPLWKLRIFCEQALEKRIPGEESAFAEGILIGERSGFSPETEEDFRRVGLTHLLALSGFNITIIAIAVLGILFWIPQNIRIGTTLFLIVFFVLFVGGGASVIRAATMGGIGLLAVHSGRRGIAFLSLVYASVIMVFLSPLILAFDPSFQLSLLGTAGILAFGERIKKALLSFFPLFFAEILATTLAAQIAVAPLIGLLFGQISLIAPLANLVVAPMIPLAMLFGFLTVITGDFFGGIFAFFAWNLLHLGMIIVYFLAKWQWASVDFPVEKTFFWILSGGIALLGILSVRKKPLRK